MGVKYSKEITEKEREGKKEPEKRGAFFSIFSIFFFQNLSYSHCEFKFQEQVYDVKEEFA